MGKKLTDAVLKDDDILYFEEDDLFPFPKFRDVLNGKTSPILYITHIYDACMDRIYGFLT